MLFVQRLQKLGLNTRSLSLKAIICTSEPLLEQHRSFLREAFSCPVVSEYGDSENGILAMECDQGNMHILSGNVLIEFIKDEKPVPFGEMGEVVVTELHSRSIPFIRYRTGDLGIPIDHDCPCGRAFPLMQVACGRDHSFIVCPDGRRVHVAMAVYVLRKGVLQFRVIQEETDRLLVQVVPDKNYNETLEKDFLLEFRKYCGRAMQVQFDKMESIPPEKNGKVLYFVSRLSSASESTASANVGG
jgi:phenylacetate-CoA ligase